MANTGILLSYGAAPYKDDPKNNPSYFVELESDGQKRKIWGVGLEEAMQKTQAKQGDNVVVNNLGNKSISIPDPENPSKSLQVRRNIWEVEEYEPPKELPNSMEQAVSREINRDSDADASMNTASIPKEKLDEFSEYELPSSIKNNYIVIAKNRFLNDEKFNFYAKDDSGKTDIVFEDRKTSINTSRQDEKTVNAMIDIAESKGWSSIKIKGTEEFKQKAWLEASLRGVEVKGYTPTEKDLAELQVKQAERTTNQVAMAAQKNPEQMQGFKDPRQMTVTPQNNKNLTDLDESTLDMINSLNVKEVQSLSEQEFEKRLKSIEDPLNNSDFLVLQALRTGNQDWIRESKQIADLNKQSFLSVDAVERRYDLSEEMRKYLEQKEKHQDAAEHISTSDEAKKYQAVIITQEFDRGARSSRIEVREAGKLGIGSYEEDGRAVINTPYSKENALELGVARYRIDEIESMLGRGEIEPYKEVVFERSPEEQAALEQESALMQAKIAEQKAMQKVWDDRYFNNLPLEQREAILDELQGDIEKQGIAWKIAEFEGSRERYDGTLDSFHQADWVREHIAARELDKTVDVNIDIEKEAYIRSAEFEAGRDIDPDLDTNLEAETERFHDNLAAPSIKGMSREESMLATERAFDRRVQNAMPQRDDLRRELGINKEDVKNIVQNGYRDGSIKNRDDLVARLQEHGFEIVRQSDKSITLSNPRGKDLRLDGEIFAKDFDALKELKNNLEPDNIRKAYPNIKDTQIAQIELQKQHLLNKFTTPQSQQQALHKLHATLPEIAAGRTDLGAPVPPSISSPNVQVRTPDTGDKSRSR